MTLTASLEQWMRLNPAPWKIGEIQIASSLELKHRNETLEAPALKILESHEAMLEWIKYDANGDYRPVRAAKSLRSGWVYKATDIKDVLQILQWIYPSAIAHYFLWVKGGLRVTEFPMTGSRQTGMYHITRHLTPDQQNELIGSLCAAKCLRQRLWSGNQNVVQAESEIPLLCNEACNYFVGQARDLIKSKK